MNIAVSASKTLVPLYLGHPYNTVVMQPSPGRVSRMVMYIGGNAIISVRTQICTYLEISGESN